MSITADEFMATAAATPIGGSSPWAAGYAATLRRVLQEQAARAPRTLQQHLGPSELGVECDRQVVGKLAALPVTNHVSDPWPSIRGTALHAYAEEAFAAANGRDQVMRWVTEQKVTAHPDHPGTADLYDANEQAVVDHKFLGVTSMTKIRNAPPRKYRAQLHLYGLGYLNLGLPVKRIAIAAYPATAASLDGLYVWEQEFTVDGYQLTPEAQVLLDEVFAQTAARRAQADELLAGRLGIDQVATHPDSGECYFCPFYRPQAAHDHGTGCPGTASTPANQN